MSDLAPAPYKVFEVYGPGGVGREHWTRLGVEAFDGTPAKVDAVQHLRSLDAHDADTWDLDPYGNPFTALVEVGRIATASEIGLFVTDGCLRKMAQMRGRLPKTCCELMGWPEGIGKDTRPTKAWIYYHYPQALRAVVERALAPRYEVADMCLVKARGPGAANYAGVIARRM